MTPLPANAGGFYCVFHVFIMTTVQSVYDMLDDRASRYGGSVADILDKTPSYLWDSPTELTMYWDEHDLSHVFPQSVFPDMSDNWTNIVAENSSVNRARGAQIMTHDEIIDAHIDAEMRALDIDVMVMDDSPEFANDLIELAFA